MRGRFRDKKSRRQKFDAEQRTNRCQARKKSGLTAGNGADERRGVTAQPRKRRRRDQHLRQIRKDRCQARQPEDIATKPEKVPAEQKKIATPLTKTLPSMNKVGDEPKTRCRARKVAAETHKIDATRKHPRKVPSGQSESV